MKKDIFFYILFFLVSNQASSQSLCKELFNRPSIIDSKENFSPLYHDIIKKANAVRTKFNIVSVFTRYEKPSWEAYNSVSNLLNALESSSYKKLSTVEKNSLKNEFTQKNISIEKWVNNSLNKPDFLEKYKKYVDENYAFFNLLEKINEKIEVRIFPRARLDLVPTNFETVQQAENLVANLNNDFKKDFAERSGYRNLEEYKEIAKNFDEFSKRALDILDKHTLVAIHAPENVRSRIPLTGFQNQRATGTSLGNLDPTLRNKAESNLLMTNQSDYEKNSVRLMPKYGEVIVDPGLIGRYQKANMYGSDLWIIKKSVIEKRATWTPEDSLRSGSAVRKVLNKIDGFIPWNFLGLATAYIHYPLKNANIFKSRWIKDELSFKSETWDNVDDYLEVQIFGDISIDDVSALYFRENPPDQKMMRYLKSKKIEVYDDRNKEGRPVKYTVGL